MTPYSLSLLAICGFSLFLSVNCRTFEVTETGGLLDALSNVNPGDEIVLADHGYHGEFVATRSGTADAPITIRGSRNALLRGDRYGFWLRANYYHLQGFAVHSSLKGIVIEHGSHNVLEDLEVKDITQEGIHFRYNSADNILRNSYVHHTGQGDATDQGYGEGVYLGQAVSNWENGEQDKSDRNQVLDNVIGPNVNGEGIDIKEGSCCGTIRGNTFNGPESNQHDADSWVDVKGDEYVIEDNTGNNPTKDGFQLHHISAAGMGGCNNVIRNNKCNGLPSGGKCVNDQSNCSNDIHDNN